MLLGLVISCLLWVLSDFLAYFSDFGALFACLLIFLLGLHVWWFSCLFGGFVCLFVRISGFIRWFGLMCYWFAGGFVGFGF